MKTIFFSVGEPSGDLHGANLVRYLRRSNIRCVGYGGPKMKQAGCELQFDLTQFAVMWLSAVLIRLPHFVRLLFAADRYFRSHPPDAVVLIDYPGFNWWIARRAKTHGIPVIYYGAPQLWAWAPWRVRKMRRLTDHVLCKLPFEVDWFRQRGCNAHYVGHPYFDELAERQLDGNFVRTMQADSRPLVTLLPGSRMQEVRGNLPTFLAVAEHLRHEYPSTRFAIASFNHAQAIAARELVAAAELSIPVHVGRTGELIEAADVCLACSGSVSLELLHHATPSIIHYRVSRLAYWLQDKFRIARYITLVNLLPVDRIERNRGESYDPDRAGAASLPMPEYLTYKDRSRQIAARIADWLRIDSHRSMLSQRLETIRQQFGHAGASQRAAYYILQQIGEDPKSVELSVSRQTTSKPPCPFSPTRHQRAG